MATKFITLRGKTREGADLRTSSLQVNSEYEPLSVIGVLPHGCDFAPASVNDARQLVEWLNDWIARKDAPADRLAAALESPPQAAATTAYDALNTADHHAAVGASLNAASIKIWELCEDLKAAEHSAALMEKERDLYRARFYDMEMQKDQAVVNCNRQKDRGDLLKVERDEVRRHAEDHIKRLENDLEKVRDQRYVDVIQGNEAHTEIARFRHLNESLCTRLSVLESELAAARRDLAASVEGKVKL